MGASRYRLERELMALHLVYSSGALEACRLRAESGDAILLLFRLARPEVAGSSDFSGLHVLEDCLDGAPVPTGARMVTLSGLVELTVGHPAVVTWA